MAIKSCVRPPLVLNRYQISGTQAIRLPKLKGQVLESASWDVEATTTSTRDLLLGAALSFQRKSCTDVPEDQRKALSRDAQIYIPTTSQPTACFAFIILSFSPAQFLLHSLCGPICCFQLPRNSCWPDPSSGHRVEGHIKMNLQMNRKTASHGSHHEKNPKRFWEWWVPFLHQAFVSIQTSNGQNCGCDSKAPQEKSIKTLCEFERAAPVVGIHRAACQSYTCRCWANCCLYWARHTAGADIYAMWESRAMVAELLAFWQHLQRLRREFSLLLMAWRD